MKERVSYGKLILSLLLFGSNGIVASHVEMSSYEIVFLRTLIGAGLLVLLYLLSRRRWSFYHKGSTFPYLAVSGAAMGCAFLFLYEAYQRIGVGIASLCYYCAPVFIMVLSPLLFGERVTGRKWACFLVVAAGIFLINGTALGEGAGGFGIFCGLMSAVMYALMLVCSKKATGITGMENATLQLVTSCLTVGLFLLWRQGFALDIPSPSLPWLALLGLVNTGVGCYLYFSSIGGLPVQSVAVCGYLEPLTAVVLSALLLGERLTLLQWLGAGCIIGGALVFQLLQEGKNHNQADRAGC